MVTDDERRKVAATMRAVSVRGVRNLTLGEVLNSILTGGAPRPTTEMAILACLADLIDRPTTRRVCKNPMAIHEKWPCDQCGFSIGDRRWKYCPNCGAEVVE